MSKDLELLIEKQFYQNDNLLGTKLLKSIVQESFIKKMNEKTLEEGRGMSFRKEGDIFQKDGQKASFVKAIILPQEGGSFQTKEETQKAIEQFETENNLKIKSVNLPNKAAMIVLLADEQGNNIAFAKYFASTPADGKSKWPEKEFGTETGFKRSESAAGKISSSVLESLPLQPSKLVGDDKERTVQKLKDHVLAKAQALVSAGQLDQITVDHITMLFDSAIGGTESPVLVGGAKYINAYDKYLGEIFAPVSLCTGWLSEGDRIQSEEIILGTDADSPKYSDMEISFNVIANEQLVDSSLKHKSGKTVLISSKAGKGAAATVSTFYKDLMKMNLQDSSPEDKESYKQFTAKNPKLFFILETISKNNWYDGPVILVKQLAGDSVLNEEDVKILNKIKTEALRDPKKFQTIQLTDNLTNLMNLYTSKMVAGYNPALHLISGIAKKAVQLINSDDSFDSGVKELMGRTGLVQINSQMQIVGETKSDCKFKSFKVKFPRVFTGKIVADATKNYSATENKGKISFKIP